MINDNSKNFFILNKKQKEGQEKNGSYYFNLSKEGNGRIFSFIFISFVCFLLIVDYSDCKENDKNKEKKESNDFKNLILLSNSTIKELNNEIQQEGTKNTLYYHNKLYQRELQSTTCNQFFDCFNCSLYTEVNLKCKWSKGQCVQDTSSK